MKKKYSNRSHNLSLLTMVANALDELCEELVFVGGCTTALFITSPTAPDARHTQDVDCIVDVLSLPEYYQFAKKLQKKGFRQSSEDEVICRWRRNAILLDIMPTNEKIFGFASGWYKNAVHNTQSLDLSHQRTIKIVTPPYFLATKIDAFKDRGKNDYLASRDLEDIVSVIDGRKEIIDEIKQSDKMVSNFLRTEFKKFLADTNFHDAIPGHLNYTELSEERTKIVIDRFRSIANLPIDKEIESVTS